VHAIHAERCPIYRSLYRAIAITTELQFEAIEEPAAEPTPGQADLPR
jgi:hypothetical protein